MIGRYFGSWWLLVGVAIAASELLQLRNDTLKNSTVVSDISNLSAVVVLDESVGIKLNVSWLPPIGGKKSKSYSIEITLETTRPPISSNTSDKSTICNEESIYHISNKSNQNNVRLPESIFAGNTALELSLIPGCTYRVEVHGNLRGPRRNYSRDDDSTPIFISLSECVRGFCNCKRSLANLQIPLVNVRSLENGIYFIIWKVKESPLNLPTKERISVKSYQVSIGLYHIKSASGEDVYNRTIVFPISINDSHHYVWATNLYDEGAKIFVTARDELDCFGKKEIRTSSTHQKSVFITVVVSILGLCLLASGICGIISYYRYRIKLNFISVQDKPRPMQSVFQNPGMERVLKHHNILYVEQEIKEARRKDFADEYEISYSRLRIIRELGHGQFGKVYLANLQRDGSSSGTDDLVAVKMSLTSLDSAQEQSDALRQELLKEIGITKMAGSHAHLVGLIGCCTLPSNPVCLVLEYMSGGDLLGYLHKLRDAAEASSQTCLESPNSAKTTSTTFSCSHSPLEAKTGSRIFFANFIKPENTNSCCSCCCMGPISQAEMMRFALEIAKGMEHLEVKGIVHRDLAARNILMDTNLTLKISDFGLSRKGAYTLNGPGVRRLPIRWMPPEAIRRRAFTSKSDIWSYGLVLWEIVSLGDFPYPKLSDSELITFLLEQEGKPEPIGCGEMRETMDMCWARKSDSRPNFRQIVKWLESKREVLSKNNPAYQGLVEDVEFEA